MTVQETLHDTVGPYGHDLDTLRGEVKKRTTERVADGWQPVSVTYRQECQHRTGRMRHVADVTFTRTVEWGK